MSAKSFELLFNDGEGLSHDDLNNAQRYLRAHVNDNIMAQMARTKSSPPSLDANKIYTIGGGGMCYADNITHLKIRNHPGTIFQKVTGSIDGLDPKFLSYNVADGEISPSGSNGIVFDTADGSHDRYDIVCVKLSQITNDSADSETRDFKDATTGVLTSQSFYKKRKVTLSVQVVKGTPASSPVEPSVPSGYVKIYSILIRATYAGFLDPTQDINDRTFPLGFERPHLIGRNTIAPIEGDSDWTVDANYGTVSTVAETGATYLVPGSNRLGSKLIRVRFGGQLSADSVVRLVRVDMTNHTVTNLTDLTTAFAALVGSLDDRVVDIGSYGPYYWLNGYTCGAQNDNVGTFDAGTFLGIQFHNEAPTATMKVMHVGFDILTSP
jgi:hypothetical protein